MILVSPTERPPFPSIGTVSSAPEKWGVDFLMHTKRGMVGVQRKALPDLVASLNDGRVAREIIDMRELDIGIWMIEGMPKWSTDGQLMQSRVTFTRERLMGFNLSIQSQGYWVMITEDREDSARSLLLLESWMETEHKSLHQRPNPQGVFGTPTSKEWLVHFIQGLPGIGHDRARAIAQFYDRSPITLRAGVDLSEIPGIGRKVADRIEKLIGRETNATKES
jgi:ERCC4-type nuclease